MPRTSSCALQHLGPAADRRAGVGKGRIGNIGALAGAGFDRDRGAERAQLLHGLRGGGDPPFPLGRFGQHCNLHGRPLSSSGRSDEEDRHEDEHKRDQDDRPLGDAEEARIDLLVVAR